MYRKSETQIKTKEFSKVKELYDKSWKIKNIKSQNRSLAIAVCHYIP